MGLDALSEKEKATLRLIVRGHDAKSIARHFDLSVHTINERLRDARRKLGVPSSREAARLLLAHETPETHGDASFGDDAAVAAGDVGSRGPASRRRPIVIGVIAMSLILALAALATAPQTSAPPAPTEAVDPAAEAAARRWLALVDAGNWSESFAGTGGDFRRLNTPAVWASMSEKVRTPLGPVRSRTLLSAEEVPAGPAGYVLVKFRTDFANRAGATETLTLGREGGAWRIMGIYIG